MSSSDSIDAPTDTPEHPEHTVADDVDPAIAEAVDGVTNRFGAQGLEQMIAYAETSLADARARRSRSSPTATSSTVRGPGRRSGPRPRVRRTQALDADAQVAALRNRRRAVASAESGISSVALPRPKGGMLP